MNINCTLNCSYQKDGKCALDEISYSKKTIVCDNSDCPYYKKRGTSKSNEYWES